MGIALSKYGERPSLLEGLRPSLLAIDPGVCDVTRKGVRMRIEGCACALFEDGRCVQVFFAAECGPQSGAVDLVLIERPHIRGNATPNPQDIVDLAWDGASLAYSLGAPVKWYLPQQWKGAVPKPVFHRRMWRALRPEERALFPAGTEDAINKACERGALDLWDKSGASYYPREFKAHNLLDAIGIGLYYIGRFDIREDTPEHDLTQPRNHAPISRRPAGRARPRSRRSVGQAHGGGKRIRGGR